MENVVIDAKSVYGMHLRFDTEENITRMDFYDMEKQANVRIIELRALEATFEINRDTRECK